MNQLQATKVKEKSPWCWAASYVTAGFATKNVFSVQNYFIAPKRYFLIIKTLIGRQKVREKINLDFYNCKCISSIYEKLDFCNFGCGRTLAH